MAEIFKEAQAFDNHPDRWNHDWSHKIYGSFKFGKIYPVMTELLQPSDSIRLDIGALLQFMPTPTPLQSNVRVVFDVFFQRMKNIQESWPNYIEQLEDHTAPYILPSVSEFVPGSIHDFLGVPCVLVRHGFEDFPTMYSYINYNVLDLQHDYLILLNSDGSYFTRRPFSTEFPSSYVTASKGICIFDYGTKHIPSGDVLIPGIVENVIKVTLSSYPFKFTDDTDAVLNSVKFRITVNNQFGFSRDLTNGVYVQVSASAFSPVPGQEGFSYDEPFVVALNRSTLLSALDTLGYEDGDVVHFDLVFAWTGYESGSSTVDPFDYDIYDSGKGEEWQIVSGSNTINYFVNNSYSLADFPTLCPYATREFPDAPIKLKAWRYRVYESNYNAFYRNIHGNQPFIVDGVTKYNQYNTTKADGQDDTHYDFFERNWELDAYTSALPSPQQGNPPMVGISATGRLTVEDDDGTRSTAQLYDLPDGQQGLSISQINIANDEHRNIIMSLASSGFTINDLREANALQKFLETNIRKGFRYIDFIKGHFGKAPKHAEMDMPEYIGGFSVRLDVGKVTNTNAAAAASSENNDNVLGAFAGSAQAFGSSKHTMQYYADDYGFVQVLMTIVPDSAYSQILPKDFLYEDPLDFPFPEFGQLGYQPIDYRHFCPIEAYKDYLEDNTKLLTDVFGYQRPQYEHVWKPDTLHGQFLTTMNNYVISRFFDGRPELGNAFFTIKPEETQNVFSVTKADNDVAFGQIAFKCEIKQPVPRIVIPSIGR